MEQKEQHSKQIQTRLLRQPLPQERQRALSPKSKEGSVGRLVTRLATYGVAGILGAGAIAWAVNREDRGVTSLQGKPVPAERQKGEISKAHEVTFINWRVDGRTIWRSAPEQSDDSLISEKDLREKWHIDPAAPVQTIDVLGVTYPVPKEFHLDRLGHDEIVNPESGNKEPMGHWQQVVRATPDGKVVEKLSLYAPDIYRKDLIGKFFPEKQK